GLELAGLDLREEADLAEVDPEERDVHLGHGPGGAEERPVAAEDDEGIRGCQLPAELFEVLGLRGPVLDAVHLAPAGRPLAEVHRRVAGRVVGEPDPPDRHGSPPPCLGATAAAISSRNAAQPGPAWRWTRNSRLPSGPRIGDAMTARAPRPMPAA